MGAVEIGGTNANKITRWAFSDETEEDEISAKLLNTALMFTKTAIAFSIPML